MRTDIDPTKQDYLSQVRSALSLGARAGRRLSSYAMSSERRLALAAVVGVSLIAAAIASDFLVESFWVRHALLTSLVANVLVVAITVVVLNQVLERRDRRRWSLLAQSTLFALTQSARATWTAMLELLGVMDVTSDDRDSLLGNVELALDTPRISAAARALVGDEDGRARLQRLTLALTEHYSEVIANWAPVMVGARPYAEILDRHVELAGRLEWLRNVLAHNEPAPDQSRRDRNLTRSSIAAETASELASDDWLHDMVVSVINLATRLDDQSRTRAFELVSEEWWSERTTGLATGT